jgi:hypothetical protein
LAKKLIFCGRRKGRGRAVMGKRAVPRGAVKKTDLTAILENSILCRVQHGAAFNRKSECKPYVELVIKGM